MPSPDLSVLIVTHNTRELLDGCLRSLRRSLPSSSEIIVVDNASADDTVEHIRREFPEVHLEISDVNSGFGAANNTGIRKATGAFILLLNPDTVVPRVSIEKLIEFMRGHPRAAAVGAQLVFPDGRIQPSRFNFPTLPREFANMFPEIKYLRGMLTRSVACSCRAIRVDSVSAAAMLVRAEAINRIAGFDDGFFLYHEERDLCRRIANQGGEIWLLPDSYVVHFDAQSTGYRRSRMAGSPVLEYRLLSMDRLWQKHKSATMYQLWRVQTRGLLAFRCFLLILCLPFLGRKSLHRIKHLWRTRKLLKGKSILGRDLEGGWATKKA
jgi:GT2 family glycosyltransferase